MKPKKKKVKRERLQENPYRAFLECFSCCVKEVQDELKEKIRTIGRPEYICGKKVPENLNMISYGVLDRLSRLDKSDDAAADAVSIVMEIPRQEVYDIDVNEVIGFFNFVSREVKRINDLFTEIKLDYSAEEITAGIENMSFGSFGVLDWYAKRMGVTNQNDVYNIAWVRIYNCMKIDNQKELFRRRLDKVYSEKIKNRNGR